MFFEVRGLIGGYGKKVVVNDLSFSVEKGELVYILGPNGCGKTTMLNMLIGYKEKMGGRILVNDTDISQLSGRDIARLIAYIPQQHYPVFNYTVKDVVVMGRTCHLSSFSIPGEYDYKLVDETLEMLGLSAFADREYMELSGGERQLVLIARAICQQASIIVMDEPFGSLDFVNGAMVARTLTKLVSRGFTIVLSTHGVINNYPNNAKVLLMGRNGSYTFAPIERIVLENKLEEAYGIPLQTICSEDKRGGRHLLCLPI